MILILLWFAFVTLVVYGFVVLITVLVERIYYKSETVDFRRSKQYRLTIIPASFVIGIFLNIWYLSYNPAHNFRTAYIEQNDDTFIVTILGKRSLMVHDPVSLFLNKTYIDSEKFEIPRANGIIDGLEILNNPDSYNILKGDAITINGKAMTVNVFYDNNDKKKADPSTLNGEYKLEWRK